MGKCRVIPSLTSRMKPKKHSPRSHGRHGGGISMKGIWGGSNRGGDIGEGRRPPSKKKCSCPTGMVPFSGGNRAGNDEELALLEVGETSGCPPCMLPKSSKTKKAAMKAALKLAGEFTFYRGCKRYNPNAPKKKVKKPKKPKKKKPVKPKKKPKKPKRTGKERMAKARKASEKAKKQAA